MAETLLQKAQRLGMQPDGDPTASSSNPPTETLLQKAQRLGIEPEAPPQERRGSMLGGMAKGLISAPATMVARPFQAIQSAAQLTGTDFTGDAARAKALTDQAYSLTQQLPGMRARGEDTTALKGQVTELINQSGQITARMGEQASWQPSSSGEGGLIAPAPQNYGDVMKDVGRGLQTVGLGMPILSGGAAFGVGYSLEQGNDLLSLETAKSTIVSMGAGKLLMFAGAPILNKAGQIIGRWTPQSLLNVAKQGEGAVSSFMKSHEILPAIGRKAVAKITSGGEAFDAAINKGTSALARGAAKIIGEQYPLLSITGQQKSILEANKKIFNESMKKGGGKYQNAIEIDNKAKADNVDLGDLLNREKINMQEYVSDKGTWDTKTDIVPSLRKTTGEKGNIMNEYLDGIEGSVPNISPNQIRSQILDEINNTPDYLMSPADKVKLIKITNKTPYKTTYNPRALNEAKIRAARKVKYDQVTGEVPDASTAAYHNIEQRVFGKNLRKVTKGTDSEKYVDDFLKDQESLYKLADILEQFHGKPVPKSWLRRVSQVLAKTVGTTVGYQAGGLLGGFAGYRTVDEIFNAIANAPGPWKQRMFAKMLAENPEPAAVAAIKEAAERLWKMKVERVGKGYILEAPGAKISAGTLFKGKVYNRQSPTSPDLVRAQNEMGAVEMGPPATVPSNVIGNDITQNLRRLFNTKQIGAPEPRTPMGDSRLGTPNPVNLYGPGGERGAIGGIRQQFTEPHALDIEKWRRSGTKETFEVWMNKQESYKKAIPVKNKTEKPIQPKKKINKQGGFVALPKQTKLFQGKGLYTKDVQTKYPNTLMTNLGESSEMQVKNPQQFKDIKGDKGTIPKGEIIKIYNLPNNKKLITDGEKYIVNKSTAEQIKQNSLKAEAKPFAPELKEYKIEGLGKAQKLNPEETLKLKELEKIDEKNPLGAMEDIESGSYDEMMTLQNRRDGFSIETLYKMEKELEKKAWLAKASGDKVLEKKLWNEANHLNARAENMGINPAEGLSPNQYSDYVLPGGKDYQEILFKAPFKEQLRVPDTYTIKKEGGSLPYKVYINAETQHQISFSSKLKADQYVKDVKNKGGTFTDNPNLFKAGHYTQSGKNKNLGGWIRLDKKTYKKPHDTTFLEETQDVTSEAQHRIAAEKFIKENFGSRDKFNVARIKRALQESVDNNSEYFAWITGEQTSARYNLATKLKEVKWKDSYNFPGERKDITLVDIDGKMVGTVEFKPDGTITDSPQSSDWKGKKLDEVLGKGLADKIMADESGKLSGEGLKFGGEWANTLYDKQVGNIVKDLTGAKIEVLDMGLPISNKQVVFKYGTGEGLEKLTPKTIKVGLEVNGFGENSGRYIITDILGDGKFKAVLKRDYETRYIQTNFPALKDVPDSYKQSFDISVKFTTQQGIRLTPEIKAMIRGEAPILKKKTLSEVFGNK